MKNHKPKTKTGPRVRELYQKYPFPRPDGIKLPRVPDFELTRLNYFLRRRGDERLAPDLKIWVAGCGTVQAIQTALNFPKAKVIGSDFSKNSIQVARKWMKELGIKNLELRCEDLLKVQYRKQFDYIVCTGVLHHLQDPAVGMKVISRALRPQGVASLLVYNSAQRRIPGLFQKMLRALGAHQSQLPFLEQMGRSLLHESLASHVNSPAHREFASEAREWDPALFADTILHPQEVSYTVTEFLEMLPKNGLEFASWLYPGSWNLKALIADPKLLKMAEKLSLKEQYQFVQNFLDDRSPSFYFLCLPKGAKLGRAYSSREFLSLRPRSIPAVDIIQFDQYKLAKMQLHQLSHLDENAWSYAPAFQPYPYDVRLDFPPKMAELYNACDGSKTIQQLIAQFSGRIEKMEIIGFCEKLLHQYSGLIADSPA